MELPSGHSLNSKFPMSGFLSRIGRYQGTSSRLYMQCDFHYSTMYTYRRYLSSFARPYVENTTISVRKPSPKDQKRHTKGQKPQPEPFQRFRQQTLNSNAINSYQTQLVTFRPSRLFVSLSRDDPNPSGDQGRAQSFEC